MYRWTEEKVNAELKQTMQKAYADLKATKAKHNCDWRTAAFTLAVERVGQAALLRGL
jgi:glutamate dehydrogenase/leucine dehydrogenase